MNKILVVAAHPDDEVLGCGATIAKHSKNGDEVHILIIAEGITSRDANRNVSNRFNDLATLKKSANHAKEILGASSLSIKKYPDNRLDSIDLLDIIKIIESHIQKYKVNIVYTHNAGDLNIDHKIVHDAVVVACRPIPGAVTKMILFFEVPSSTEWQISNTIPPFSPNWFVDVKETFDIKLKALECYSGELREWPHPRSYDGVRHLACWRGASIGVEYAEAFVFGRNLS
jgi:N-acetylglucosamine malate deacetylase 1